MKQGLSRSGQESNWLAFQQEANVHEALLRHLFRL